MASQLPRFRQLVVLDMQILVYFILNVSDAMDDDEKIVNVKIDEMIYCIIYSFGHTADRI